MWHTHNIYIYIFYCLSLYNVSFNFNTLFVKRTRFFVHTDDFLARLYRGKVDRVVQKSSHAVIVSAHTHVSCVRTNARTHSITIVIITPTVIRFESRPKRSICSCCTTRPICVSHFSLLVPSRIASARCSLCVPRSFCNAICSDSDLPT